MTLRLVLADDHVVVLEGLRALLSLEPDMQVVALCTDGDEAVEAVLRRSPDVLVLDAAMPEVGGVEAVRRLIERGVHVPTIVLAAALDDDALMQFLEYGVEGLILKESAVAELVGTIRRVAEGGRAIQPALSDRAMALLVPGTVDDELGALTPRERRVVGLVLQGISNKSAASAMGIAVGTVKFHLHNAFRKLGVANRVQLVLLAKERGWA